MTKVLESLKEFRRYHQYLKIKRAIEKPNWSEKITPKVFRWLRQSGMIAIILISSCYNMQPARAETLTASWYSIQSLKKEGTYKYSKGVMANGNIFMDNNLTCATRLFPLGSLLRITRIKTKTSVVVLVTDRIGKRFAKKRIDLSKLAFSRIAELKTGIVAVKVEKIK
jgi:rare lipoprotein A